MALYHTAQVKLEIAREERGYVIPPLFSGEKVYFVVLLSFSHRRRFLAAVQGHMKTGALKPLAVTTAKRVPGVDLPTMAEAGLPGYETSTWGGILAPANTPKDVVAKLNAQFNKDLAQPDIKKKISDAGIEIAGGTPQQFADFIQAEMKKWAKVAKDANIQPE